VHPSEQVRPHTTRQINVLILVRRPPKNIRAARPVDVHEPHGIGSIRLERHFAQRLPVGPSDAVDVEIDVDGVGVDFHHVREPIGIDVGEHELAAHRAESRSVLHKDVLVLTEASGAALVWHAGPPKPVAAARPVKKLPVPHSSSIGQSIAV
jgi:hypothetical protein